MLKNLEMSNLLILMILEKYLVQVKLISRKLSPIKKEFVMHKKL